MIRLIKILLLAKIKLLLFILLLHGVLFAQDSLESFRQGKNRISDKQAVYLAKKSVETYIKENRRISPPSDLSPLFSIPAGVIVTIRKDGVVVGCMGSIEPTQPDFAREIINSSILACSGDYWFPPLQEKDLGKLQFVISVLGKIKKITSSSQLDPIHKGLLVRKGNRSALLLPGEAKTPQWQVYQCKKKAGIPQNERVEMFIFDTVVFQEE